MREASPNAAAAAPSASKQVTTVLLVAVGVGVLLLVGLFALIVGGITRSAPGTTARPGAAPAEPAPARESRLFYYGYSAPQIVTSAGAETVIALFRALDEGDELLFIALDPATQKERWRVRGLGTYSEGHQHTFAAVAGQRVAVTDHRSTLRVFDVQSGKELSKVVLTDKPDAMCALPSGNRVIVSQVDEKALYVDLTSGRTEPAPRFGACWEVDPVSGQVRWRFDRSAPAEPRPRDTAGFELRRHTWEKDVAVASGVSAPGTAYPMAQGYDPKTSAVLWTQPVYSVDKGSVKPDSNQHGALRNGVFVTTYGVGSEGWRLTAFTAKDGHRLWETELAKLDSLSDPGGIVLSSTRAYVGRGNCLEWYGLKDGKLQGTFGWRETR